MSVRLGRPLTLSLVAITAILVVAPLRAQVDTGQLRLFKYLMGTSMRIELSGGDTALRQQAAEEAFAAIAAVDRTMSDYRGDSELARLNAAGAGEPQTVSGPLFAVLAAAERVSVASGGAFRIVPGHQGAERPFVLNAAERSVRRARPDLRLSLDGLAKGFAAEVAAGSLRRRGLSGTVDTGGVQYMVGRPVGKRNWTVGISNPWRRDALVGAIDLEAGAVSTVTSASVPLDPRSGRPTGPAVSATVLSTDGTLADALSRAALVLGPTDGLELLTHFPDTWGVIVTRRADGRPIVSVSPGRTTAFHPSAS